MTELATAQPAATCPMAPRGWPNPLLEEYDQLPPGRPLTKVTMPSGTTAWLVAQHEHVRRLLADPRVSANQSHPTFPIRFEVTEEVLEMIRRDSSALLVGMDHPRHTQCRRMVMPDFAVKRVQGLRPRVQQIIDEHLDAIEASAQRPVDLVQVLALPVPAHVVCELADIPLADRAEFQRNAAIMVANRHSYSWEEKLAANAALMAYFDQLITEKEREPGDDMLSRLVVNNRENGGDLDHSGLVFMTKMLLLAGYEFIVNRIALGTEALLQHPEQLAALRADPETMLPKTVEEVLRYFSLVDEGVSRVATEDIEIDGVLIRSGEGIIVLKGLADRDGRAFQDPDTFDIHRDARDHLAFGFGAHQCLGQHVTRLMLEMSLHSLLTRFPDLRLAAPAAAKGPAGEQELPPVHQVMVTW